MKAMTLLKIGGCVLVALAALAAADTRYVETTGNDPWQIHGRAIASETGGCPASHMEKTLNSGCCAKEKKAEEARPAGCCRK